MAAITQNTVHSETLDKQSQEFYQIKKWETSKFYWFPILFQYFNIPELY